MDILFKYGKTKSKTKMNFFMKKRILKIKIIKR